MSTILDVVNVRLNSIEAKVDATDNKVGVEATARANADASLGSRVTSLEQTVSAATDELVAKQAQIDTLTGRVDLLVQQLTELGVDAEI